MSETVEAQLRNEYTSIQKITKWLMFRETKAFGIKHPYSRSH